MRLSRDKSRASAICRPSFSLSRGLSCAIVGVGWKWGRKKAVAQLVFFARGRRFRAKALRPSVVVCCVHGNEGGPVARLLRYDENQEVFWRIIPNELLEPDHAARIADKSGRCWTSVRYSV
jgi:hypothetical protein